MPPQRKFSAKVLAIESFGEKVKRFTLLPEQAIPRFKNGQFLHLAMDEYDPSSNWPDSRAFSIASSKDDNTIEIIVSKKGRFTQRMFQDIKPGQKVWIRMPFGVFNLDKIENSAVLIAGGTGISPFISFLKSQYNIDLHLFYGVLNEELLIINDLVKDLNKSSNNIVHLYFEQSPVNNFPNMQIGRIDLIKAVENANENHSSIYISGPPALISATIDIAKKRGIPDSNLYFDEWQ
jgi:ferredoxin-NADP reductase